MVTALIPSRWGASVGLVGSLDWGPQFGDRDLVVEKLGSGVRPMCVDSGLDSYLAVWPKASDFPSLSLTSPVIGDTNEPYLTECFEEYRS